MPEAIDTTDTPDITGIPFPDDTIIQPPETLSRAVGESAVFTCEANGLINWAINGITIETQEQVQRLASIGITVPFPSFESFGRKDSLTVRADLDLSCITESTVTISSVTVSLDMTSLQCLVVGPTPDGGFMVVNSSEEVQLLVVMGKYNTCMTHLKSIT